LSTGLVRIDVLRNGLDLSYAFIKKDILPNFALDLVGGEVAALVVGNSSNAVPSVEDQLGTFDIQP
jgi:hypothetical protein